MKIVVLVKQVPDTYGERKLDPATGMLDREASEPIIDEIDERALEIALSYKDSEQETPRSCCCRWGRTVHRALRKGLSMGADSAVHVVDDALAGR